MCMFQCTHATWCIPIVFHLHIIELILGIVILPTNVFVCIKIGKCWKIGQPPFEFHCHPLNGAGLSIILQPLCIYLVAGKICTKMSNGHHHTWIFYDIPLSTYSQLMGGRTGPRVLNTLCKYLNAQTMVFKCLC